MTIRKQEAGSSEERFERYIQGLTEVIGHADRAEPLKAYCTGLLLPGERKSVEPMAAKIEPARVSNRHQSMHHFVADAPWSDREVLSEIRRYGLPALLEHGGVQTWMVDDTGHPKKGTHSVGVAKQYCGQLGKTENCQVAVSLSLANQSASLPIAYRLFLPEVWAKDMARRRTAGVPDEVVFKTKPQIALDQIRAAVKAGVPPGVVDADAGYGNDTDFRDQITALGLRYAVGIQPTTSVWAPGTGPLPPAPSSGRGQPPKLLRRDADHKAVSVKELALSLPEGSFRKVTWREGTKGAQHSRFVAVRVRPAHRDYQRTEPRPEEWLLIEWPEGEAEPTKYWLSTLPKRTSVKKLVETAKLRWRIERDYQELKDEIGLGHFEGRSWRGFHHHATLSIAAYAFLVAERGLFSPSGVGGGPRLEGARLPRGYRPRGAPDPTRAPQPDLDHEHAGAHHRRARQASTSMPLLSGARQSRPSTDDEASRKSGQRES
jgi:SRSO17 transposase